MAGHPPESQSAALNGSTSTLVAPDFINNARSRSPASTPPTHSLKSPEQSPPASRSQALPPSQTASATLHRQVIHHLHYTPEDVRSNPATAEGRQKPPTRPMALHLSRTSPLPFTKPPAGLPASRAPKFRPSLTTTNQSPSSSHASKPLMPPQPHRNNPR